MATTVGTQNDMNELLVKLIELDYDAVEAYKASVERLEAADIQAQLREFQADHERHIQELGGILRQSGRTPPQKGDAKGMLTKGKVVVAGLAGDKAILQAMKTNEDDTNQAYERAVNNDVVPAQVREVLKSALSDERRHRTWIQERLSSM